MKIKVSDAIALFFANNNMKHLFGIIGAGNAHLFDSIYKISEIEMICVHHEQAACMATQTYFRTNGIVTSAVLTTGAGSTNGITGVLSSWADSIPTLIVSGNEHSKYIFPENDLRMYGVQGYDSSFAVSKITKYSVCITDPTKTLFELEKALYLTSCGRPGPCWVDIPMNIQSTMIEENELLHFDPKSYQNQFPVKVSDRELLHVVHEILEELRVAKRPVIWLGNGINLAGANHLLSELMSILPSAYLVSWAGIDLVNSDHPHLFGRAGVYGQRYSNFILQNSDYVLTIGTRLSLSQVGYDISEFARGAKLTVVDIDQSELNKYPTRYDRTVCANAKNFIEIMINCLNESPLNNNHFNEWIIRCNTYKSDFPIIDVEHNDTNGFINSYKFMARLNDYFKPNQVVVTDMGTALLSGHQVLKFEEGQRFMTSTGLGEMGYGLPAAIGASFANNRSEVLCLNCDGGMMMNLQELQTIVHHKLPIKIIVFNNDGYLMIKHTQKSIANGRYSGVNKSSGLSCPDFKRIAYAFGMESWQIRTWEDFDKNIVAFLNHPTFAICEVFMDPEQLFVPKLSLSISKDGNLVSPPLEDLFPFIDRSLLESNMIVGLHPKSQMIN